jgi:hypothetical protein
MNWKWFLKEMESNKKGRFAMRPQDINMQAFKMK